MPDPSSVGANVAKEIINAAVEAGLIDRLLDTFKKKNRVLVLGSSGVGKNNMQTSLTNELTFAVDRLNRTEFATDSRVRIQKTPFIFKNTPGQTHHQTRRLNAIRQQMAKGKFGIINVVCFGYHEGVGNKTDAIDSSGKVKQDYLEHCRKLEIDAVSEWSSLLGSRDTANWLITVVNKADLWWHQQEEVMHYYTSGAYAQNLGDAKVLGPIVVPYCATIHKFFDEGALSAHFDVNDQIHCKARLLTALLSSVEDGQHE